MSQRLVLLAFLSFAGATAGQILGYCKTTCGQRVPSGWRGYNDGPDHCQTCTCLLGTMRCTREACSEHECPAEMPANACKAADFCPEGKTCAREDGVAQCFKSCTTDCGETVEHGWEGVDDGSNHCNNCTCTDGEMMCTDDVCSPRPCAEDVCGSSNRTCGHLIGGCPTNHVCLDDPADTCEPSVTQLCSACCVFDECLLADCPRGTTCQLDEFGMPQCVLDISSLICCKALPVCPSGSKEVRANECTREDFEEGACIKTTKCCTTLTCRVA